MERHDRSVLTLFWEETPLREGTSVELSGSALQHAHVRRARVGEQLRLLDGQGRIAFAEVGAIEKRSLVAAITRVTAAARPSVLEVVVPVADRDRMLLAAEKCAELQVTSWRPVYYARSRSVSPRGEGPKFAEKLRARMTSALEQSGSPWLPSLEVEREWRDLVRDDRLPETRLLLSSEGAPLASLVRAAPTIIAAGPEGGLEPAEVDAARVAGWTLASLGATTLRFETALMAAVAVVRAVQLTHRSD